MKNFKFLYLLAIASLAFTSCSKDDDNTKAEEPGKRIIARTSAASAYRDSLAYVYNTEGKIIESQYFNNALINGNDSKVNLKYSTEFKYDKDKIQQRFFYEWSGTTKTLYMKDTLEYATNTIKLTSFNFIDSKFVFYRTQEIQLNSSNQPVKFIFSELNYTIWEYSSNNIVTIKEFQNGTLSRTLSYSFDTKKSHLKGIPDLLLNYDYYNTNNITKEISSTGIERNFTYEYDADEYPISITQTTSSNPYSTSYKVYYVE